MLPISIASFLEQTPGGREEKRNADRYYEICFSIFNSLSMMFKAPLD